MLHFSVIARYGMDNVRDSRRMALIYGIEVMPNE